MAPDVTDQGRRSMARVSLGGVPEGRLWKSIVFLAAVVLVPIDDRTRAVAAEGNCCCAVSGGGNVCFAEDQFLCASRECTFLGNEPCPALADPCPTPPTGNCCCALAGGGSECSSQDQFNCEFRDCLFIGADACPPQTQPCPLETGNCCCNGSGGGSTCSSTDVISCGIDPVCVFLGDQACPPATRRCPNPNGVTCLDNLDCVNACIGGLCTDPADVGETCDPGDNEDCAGDAVCGTNNLCEDRSGCDSNDDCPDEDPNDCLGSACNLTTGLCVEPRLSDGTPCDDGNACTDEDRCLDGECKDNLGPAICPPPDPPLDQCNTRSCDPQGGVFNCDLLTPLANGTSCTNTDRCSVGDMCQDGNCVEGVPIECPSHLVCVDGNCVSPVQEVIVSLLPGSCIPTPLNRRSRGVLPAAILGAADFDVHSIDLDTIRLARIEDAQSVAPTRTTFEDIGGPHDAEACGSGDNFALVPDAMTDLSVKFDMEKVIPTLELECFPSGNLLALQLTGKLMDGSPFSGASIVKLVGPGCDCDECQRYVDGKCSPCPGGTVCVGNGDSAHALSSAASDTASDPECLTPCTSDLDCFTSTKCEECRDGFCRSRCPGKCSDDPQPCMECDGAGTCRPCCPEAQFCPSFALDCRFCCRADQICSADKCVGCASDDDCNTDECETCREGACVTRCTAGQLCIAGTCRQACDTHADCPDCQVCIGGLDSHCFPCAAANCDLCPLCTRCAADQECVDGRCVPRQD